MRQRPRGETGRRLRAAGPGGGIRPAGTTLFSCPSARTPCTVYLPNFGGGRSVISPNDAGRARRGAPSRRRGRRRLTCHEAPGRRRCPAARTSPARPPRLPRMSAAAGGGGGAGAEGSTRTHTAPLAAAADASLRRRARRRTRRRAVRRASSSARRGASSASHETRLGCELQIGIRALLINK